MLTVQSGSMDADSESVQGIKTMNRQEKEDQAQIEYLRRWKEKKQKRKNLLEKLLPCNRRKKNDCSRRGN